MYRTATLAVYDVMDQVHINAVVMQYPAMPGEEPPERLVWSQTVSSVGAEDPREWLWRAMQALQDELHGV